MKKIALTIISIMLLSGLSYGNDVPEGVIRKAYFDSGVLKVNEGNYMGENFNGFHIELYETGKLKSEEEYKDGKLIDRKEYDEEGNIVSGGNKEE